MPALLIRVGTAVEERGHDSGTWVFAANVQRMHRMRQRVPVYSRLRQSEWACRNYSGATGLVGIDALTPFRIEHHPKG